MPQITAPHRRKHHGTVVESGNPVSIAASAAMTMSLETALVTNDPSLAAAPVLILKNRLSDLLTSVSELNIVLVAQDVFIQFPNSLAELGLDAQIKGSGAMTFAALPVLDLLRNIEGHGAMAITATPAPVKLDNALEAAPLISFTGTIEGNPLELAASPTVAFTGEIGPNIQPLTATPTVSFARLNATMNVNMVLAGSGVFTFPVSGGQYIKMNPEMTGVDLPAGMIARGSVASRMNATDNLQEPGNGTANAHGPSFQAFRALDGIRWDINMTANGTPFLICQPTPDGTIVKRVTVGPIYTASNHFRPTMIRIYGSMNPLPADPSHWTRLHEESSAYSNWFSAGTIREFDFSNDVPWKWYGIQFGPSGSSSWWFPISDTHFAIDYVELFGVVEQNLTLDQALAAAPTVTFDDTVGFEIVNLATDTEATVVKFFAFAPPPTASTIWGWPRESSKSLEPNHTVLLDADFNEGISGGHRNDLPEIQVANQWATARHRPLVFDNYDKNLKSWVWPRPAASNLGPTSYDMTLLAEQATWVASDNSAIKFQDTSPNRPELRFPFHTETAIACATSQGYPVICGIGTSFVPGQKWQIVPWGNCLQPDQNVLALRNDRLCKPMSSGYQIGAMRSTTTADGLPYAVTSNYGPLIYKWTATQWSPGGLNGYAEGSNAISFWRGGDISGGQIAWIDPTGTAYNYGGYAWKTGHHETAGRLRVSTETELIYDSGSGDLTFIDAIVSQGLIMGLRNDGTFILTGGFWSGGQFLSNAIPQKVTDEGVKEIALIGAFGSTGQAAAVITNSDNLVIWGKTDLSIGGADMFFLPGGQVGPEVAGRPGHTRGGANPQGTNPTWHWNWSPTKAKRIELGAGFAIASLGDES